MLPLPTGFNPLDLSMELKVKIESIQLAARFKTSLFEAPDFRHGVCSPCFPCSLCPPCSLLSLDRYLMGGLIWSFRSGNRSFSPCLSHQILKGLSCFSNKGLRLVEDVHAPK